MAHSCPECGYLCHCGGDVEDMELENTREQRLCAHCPIEGVDDSGICDGCAQLESECLCDVDPDEEIGCR